MIPYNKLMKRWNRNVRLVVLGDRLALFAGLPVCRFEGK
jgi:hypothetical protein